MRDAKVLTHILIVTRAGCLPSPNPNGDYMKSKSDEVLAAQLEGAGVKQNVTFAEAVAEAKANSADGTDGTTPAAKTKAKKEKAEGDAPAAPRIKVAPGSTPAQVLAAHLGSKEAVNDACRLVVGDKATDAQAESVGGVINKLAKKVAEKAVNLLRHKSSPDNVQVYTRIAMEKLVKDGELTSKGLVEHYLGRKYKDGTARAQANQIMQLFPALKVADKTGSTMTLNDDSVIVQAYRAAKG